VWPLKQAIKYCKLNRNLLRYFIYKLLTHENKESSSCSHAVAYFVLVISISFICGGRKLCNTSGYQNRAAMYPSADGDNL